VKFGRHEPTLRKNALKGRRTTRHKSGRHVTSTSKVMQKYGEVKLQLPSSSNSVPDEVEWSCSRHLPLYPKKSATQHPLNMRLGWHQSPWGRLGKQKSIAPNAQHAPIPWSPIPQSRRHGIILTLRRLMSYIYGAPILDVSRSHTTTQHSR